jgi:hypothetical protein
VKTLCASIREKYDQPWVFSKILEYNVEEEEWDDLEEDTNLDEFLPPDDQANNEEFISKEPPYLEHALYEEDFTSPRKEPKEEVFQEGYQPLEEEQESPHDSIEDNGDLIEEREPEEVNHEEDHQIHEVEHEFPCEYVEEEHFDETHHVEDLIHEEAPHEDEASIFSPPFDEVIQASIPPTHEEENMVSYTPFQVFDVASFHDSKKVKKC